jgi:hypothetical protein
MDKLNTWANKWHTHGMLHPHISIDIPLVEQKVAIHTTWQRYSNVFYFNLY